MKWQPAETAPRDGTVFLALLRTREDQKVGTFTDIVQYYYSMSLGHVWDAPRGGSYDLGCLTHWVEVPPYPTEEEAAGDR